MQYRLQQHLPLPRLISSIANCCDSPSSFTILRFFSFKPELIELLCENNKPEEGNSQRMITKREIRRILHLFFRKKSLSHACLVIFEQIQVSALYDKV